MPKSKGRKKQSSRRYQLGTSPKAKRKTSPRWYGPLLIVVMAIGVLVIVLNYAELLPGVEGTSPLALWVGLGLIGAGFVGTTFWH